MNVAQEYDGIFNPSRNSERALHFVKLSAKHGNVAAIDWMEKYEEEQEKKEEFQWNMKQIKE